MNFPSRLTGVDPLSRQILARLFQAEGVHLNQPNRMEAFFPLLPSEDEPALQGNFAEQLKEALGFRV